MTSLQRCLLHQFFIHPNLQKLLLCLTLSFAHAVHLIRVIYCLPIVIFMCVPFCCTRGQTLEGRNCPVSHLVSPTLVPEINKCVDVDGKKAIALAHRRVWWAGLVLPPNCTVSCSPEKLPWHVLATISTANPLGLLLASFTDKIVAPTPKCMTACAPRTASQPLHSLFVFIQQHRFILCL